MSLYKRTYQSESCRLAIEKDENSAVNMHPWSLARLAAHRGNPTRYVTGEPGGVAITGAARVAHVQT